MVHAPPGDPNGVEVRESFIGTSYAVRRDLFLRLGGFHTYLFHQEEEREYCLRLFQAGYVTRVGRADPIYHYESPIRSYQRILTYGARNRILYIWYNVPGRYLLPHLASTTWHLLRRGVKMGHVRWTFDGLAKGYRGCVHEWRERRPVGLSVFRLSRRMLRTPVLPLADVEPYLPTPTPQAVPTNA
jgi:GT2 family glycosyltransferase